MKDQDKTREKKMSVPELIDHCQNDLGILFEKMSVEKASRFLQKNNSFSRLIQYAEVWEEKTKSGKYIGLDFAHLVELSTIDMFFRKLVLKMAIDFEHYLKVGLVNECQNDIADDGYEVVESFLREKPQVKKSVTDTIRNPEMIRYSSVKYDKDLSNLAVWNLLEVLSFNELISFYDYYYRFFRREGEYTKHFDSVRRLRNACAHNACLLCNFRPVQNFKHDLQALFELLNAKLNVGQGVISTCMKVPLLNDFAVMLKVYSKIVSSKSVKQFTFEELKDFFTDRAIRNKELFEHIVNVKNAYDFAVAVVEHYSEPSSS